MQPVIPQRHLPCPTCGLHLHALLPTVTGATWICDQCKGETHSYTHDDMRDQLVQFAKQIKEAPAKYQGSLEGIQVRVRFQASLDPVVLDPVWLRQHVEITGALPVVGKPLCASIPGVPTALVTIPYGVVVTVTKNEEHSIS